MVFDILVVFKDKGWICRLRQRYAARRVVIGLIYGFIGTDVPGTVKPLQGRE